MADAGNRQAVRIGRTEAGKVLKVPMEIVCQTIGILGIRGSGKTVSAKTICERMLAGGYEVAVIDPLDVWWGLRSSAVGKSEGYKILILGGDHADAPLEASSGKVIADFLTESKQPVILSLRHLSKGDQRRFTADFGERLYRRRGEAKYRTPMHLFIDEADAFAPQRLYKDATRCFGAIDDLVRRGRAFGIGVTLISQRPQALNKDVLSQVEALLIMRILSPHDLKAIEAWVERHDAEGVADKVMRTLHTLKIGQGWLWSPGADWPTTLELLTVDMCETFDSSATPKLRARAAVPTKVAPIDLASLSKEIQATVERAKDNDPAALKRRIAQLERDARKAQPAAASGTPAEPKMVVQIEKVPVLTAADRKLFESFVRAVEAMTVKAADGAKVIKHILVRLDRFPPGGKTRPLVNKPQAAPATGHHPVPSARGAARPVAAVAGSQAASFPAAGDGELSKCERAIVTVLTTDGPSIATRIAIRTGYSYKSGSFRNALSRLRTGGLIVGGNKQSIAITDVGVHAIGEVDPLPVGEALFAYWCGHVPKPCREILTVLRPAWPGGLSIEDIADATPTRYSPTSGSFRNALSKLRTLQLIEGPDRSGAIVRLKDDFAEAAT